MSLNVNAVDKVNIALIFDGPGLEDYSFFKVLREEVFDLLADDFEVEFTNSNGNWSVDSVQVAVDQALEDPKVDAIVTLGLLASQEILFKGDFSKPIAIPYVMSQEVQKMLNIDPESIPKNLILILGKKLLKDDIKTLASVRPFKSIAIIGDDSFLGEDFKFLRNGFKSALADQDVQLRFIPIKESVDGVISLLEQKPVDAVFFYPTWRVSPTNFERLILALSDMGVASFSYLGEQEVEKGVLLTTTPKGHLKRVSRRVGLNLLELLSDELYGEVDLEYPEDWDLIVNRGTAEKLGVSFSWDLMGTARFIGDSEQLNEGAMNITQIANIALENNQDITTEEFKVRVQMQEMCIARSELLPRITGVVDWTAIDADRARIAGGLFPQYNLRSNLVLTQPIIDDTLVTNYCVQKKGYLANQYAKKSLELDIVLQVSLAYINYLKSQAAVDIAYDNLMLTKANLKRAKERVKAGEAGNAEIYRWESELSANHESLIATQTKMETIKVTFNRILNRALDTDVYVEELDINSAKGSLYLPEYDTLLDDMNHLKLLKKHMQKASIENSPELKAIREQVEAQYKIYTSVKRSRILPKVSVKGEIGRNARGGAGKRVVTGLPIDDTEMFLGVQASLPIFTSGAISSEQKKACNEMKRLQSEWKSVEQKIKERVTQGIDQLKNQHYSIQLATRSEEAAKKNLKIVANLYARGSVSIVDLIDAQNATLAARIAKLNSDYDFLLEMVRLERSVGEFYFLETPEKKEEMKEKLFSECSFEEEGIYG